MKNLENKVTEIDVLDTENTTKTSPQKPDETPVNSSIEENKQEPQLKKQDKNGEHLVIMPHNNRKIEINKDTNFGKKSKFGEFMFKIAWGISVGILWCYTKAFLGLKVEGLENKEKLEGKDKGYLIVSNHMHVMDTPLVAVTLKPTRIQFTSIEQNFSIPVIGRILSFFNVLPLPESPYKLKYVFDYINGALKEGKVVHFFPEGILLPYNNELKTFNRGAFICAEKNNVPILPIVYTQRKATGIFKFLKKHRCSYTAHILEPQTVDRSLKKKESIEELDTRVKQMMIDTIDKYDENVVGFKYENIK